MARVKHPIQPIVRDSAGVLRFHRNKIVEFLLDRGRFNLNDLALMNFTDDDRAQLAQLIGYSVSGFGELSYVSRKLLSQVDATTSEEA